MKYSKIPIVIIAALLALCFAVSASAHTIVGLSNFERTVDYVNGTFVDIQKDDWYTENVKSAYEYGLMEGKEDAKFDPNGKISLAEVITVAVRINAIYTLGNMPAFDTYSDDLWYSPYLRYAQEFSVIDDAYPNYNAAATRAQFAQILANSIDSIDLDEINLVDDGAIPDVDMNADYADAVYLLYRAGVLTGSDETGTFYPDSTITRAEAAAIITRIVDPSLRKNIELVGEY